MIAHLTAVGDADDIWYDARARRIYITGGEGYISIIVQHDADHYEPVEKIPTAPSAHTSFFAAELERLYVAVPRRPESGTPCLRHRTMKFQSYRKEIPMSIKRVLMFSLLLFVPSFLGAQGLDTTKIDQALGRSGQKLGNAYKIGFPRTDLHVTRHGVVIKPGLALGSWAAFEGSDDNAMVMGDLVLLQDEVNPVMATLRDRGFEILALHNHLLDETPHVMYMHYMGKGKAEELAAILKSALEKSKTPLGKPASPVQAAAEPAFVRTVEDTLGRKGSFSGGVLTISVPRADTIVDRGMTIPPAMGMAESINFQETGSGNVATTGDFVLVATEVNPVISALEAHHIEVEALHNHMLDEEPRLFFMHFWGEGPADSVAQGIKAASEKVRTK